MFESSAAYVRRSKERLMLDSKGTVVSFTRVYENIKGFNRNVPFVLALIEIDNEKKVVGEIVGHKDLKIGCIVESCFRKIYTDGEEGIVNYGIKWVIK